MLEGEIPSSLHPDPHHRKQLYKSMQSFADASLKLCESGKLKKFEEYLKVAHRLFREGNTIIRDAIINVYLFTVCRTLDQNQELNESVVKLFPSELTLEYNKFHHASGV